MVIPCFITGTLSNISAFAKRSDETSRGRCFWAPSLWQFFAFPNPLLESFLLFPFSYSILLLSVADLIAYLNSPKFTLCPHFHPSVALMAAHFSPLLEPLMPFKSTRFLHSTV